MKLHRALLDYEPILLAGIAECRGIELKANHQGDTVEQVATALLDPESVQEAITWLSPGQRRALDALLVASGQLPAARFSRDHGAVRRMGPGRLEREKPWRDPQSPAEALFYAGLIFFGFDEIEGQIIEVVFVPDDLLPLLPTVEAGSEDLSISIVSSPQVVRDVGRALAEDLTTLLAWVETEVPRLQHDGTLYPRDLTRLDERLTAPQDPSHIRHEREAGRLSLLLHLARRLELMAPSEGRLRLRRPPTKEWLRADLPSQMLTLQQAWRDAPEWSDIGHVPSLRLERSGWGSDALSTRLRLLKHLARCPTDRWIALVSFIAAIKQADPDFLRPSDAHATWYIRDAVSDEYLTGFENWEQVEGALIACLISGPLHWLGVTALGSESLEETPTAFHLTPGGALFLGLTDQAPASPVPPPMSVDADLTVRAVAGSNLYDRFQLARIAEWQASGEVFVYQITRASLSRALGQGIRLDQVLTFLRRVTGNRLPPRAAQTLRSWAGQHGQVRLTRTAVLETETAAVMQKLCAHPAIGPLLSEPLSPTRILVAEQNWRQVSALLQQLGYLPTEKGDNRR